MTAFVEIAPESYDSAAFDEFTSGASNFEIGNARALMWMSQLAYETHTRNTIEIVSPKWGFSSITSFTRSFETCGVIGERPDAVVLAFAGTDPGIWQNLVTDGVFRIDPATDTHVGFQEAALSAKDDIAKAVQRCRDTQKPLFVAGHSLGAALAALAAKATTEAGIKPQAVYIYGMPRAGGAKFKAAYDSILGDRTFRLVHGIDLVARVPMSAFGYRHVGRVLMCTAGAKFDPAQPFSTVASDEPQFSDELSNILRRTIGDLLMGQLLSKPGSGMLGRFFRFLRPEIRDHLPDSYWTALTP